MSAPLKAINRWSMTSQEEHPGRKQTMQAKKAMPKKNRCIILLQKRRAKTASRKGADCGRMPQAAQGRTLGLGRDRNDGDGTQVVIGPALAGGEDPAGAEKKDPCWWWGSFFTKGEQRSPATPKASGRDTGTGTGHWDWDGTTSFGKGGRSCHLLSDRSKADEEAVGGRVGSHFFDR
jgi:hypothetical protein